MPNGRRIGFWLLVAAASVTGACAQDPSPDALLAEIETTGPRVVLQRLWADERQFSAVCEAIETAEPDWLEVARRLKSVSDAGISLSLNYCVAKALPVGPTRVLGLVGRNFTVEDLCTSPFIEPDAGWPSSMKNEL